MIYTTLNKILAHGPCEDGWRKLLKHLDKTEADDEPLPLLTVLDSNGLDHCIWCLRAVPERAREWRLFAVWCARKVQHLMTDSRSIAALHVAERFANGEATEEELFAAQVAARDAARDAAWDAAWVAARAAAWAAAWDAAQDAAWVAALTAARAAAWDAAQDAALTAAWAAAWAEQEAELRRILTETT
jgi:hypothetical protein